MTQYTQNEPQTPSIAALVAKGLKSHKQNDYASARLCYEKVLESESQNEDALHLLGMLCHAEGDATKAIEWISAAIKANQNIAIFHNNLGNIHFISHAYAKAETAFSAALALNSKYLEAQFNLANVHYENKDSLLAEDAYEKTLSIDAEFIPALTNLSDMLIEKEDYTSAYHLLKNTKSIKINADLHEKYIRLLSLCCEQTEDVSLKKELIDEIIKNDSSHVDAIYNLANAHKDRGDFVNADKFYHQVILLDEAYFGAWVNSGVIDTWFGRFDAAIEKFNRAFLLNATDYSLLNNLGMAHQSKRNTNAAVHFYEKAIAIDEKKPEAYWNYSLLLLLMGNYRKGWEYYEYRWQIKGKLLGEKRQYAEPMWQGESLENKILFVYCEQGYGDSLQFIRYLLALINEGQKIVLECPNALVKLFKLADHRLIVLSENDINKKNIVFDYHIPMMSLPLAFGFRFNVSPCVVPYLKTKSEDVVAWGELLSATKNKKVGVVWSGNPRIENLESGLVDQRRSCSLTHFSVLFELNNINFYSLQKENLEVSNYDQLQDCMTDVSNFYDTACIIQNLDLVISVDTAVAHLAAALGKPVWLLSRYDGCWRWLLDRDDSPWYPTLRLFRQEKPNEWRDVLNEIKNSLREI